MGQEGQSRARSAKKGNAMITKLARLWPLLLCLSCPEPPEQNMRLGGGNNSAEDSIVIGTWRWQAEVQSPFKQCVEICDGAHLIKEYTGSWGPSGPQLERCTCSPGRPR